MLLQFDAYTWGAEGETLAVLVEAESIVAAREFSERKREGLRSGVLLFLATGHRLRIMDPDKQALATIAGAGTEEEAVDE